MFSAGKGFVHFSFWLTLLCMLWSCASLLFACDVTKNITPESICVNVDLYLRYIVLASVAEVLSWVMS